MPDYRVIARYGVANYGWSETYFLTTNLTPANWFISDAFEGWLIARRFCMSPFVQIVSVTLIDLANPKASTPKAFNQGGLFGTQPLLDDTTPDVPHTAALLGYSSDRARRSQWVRGLPDSQVFFQQGRFVLGPAVRESLNTLKNATVDLFSIRNLRPETFHPWRIVSGLSKSVVPGYEGYTAVYSPWDAEPQSKIYFRRWDRCGPLKLSGAWNVLLPGPGVNDPIVIDLRWPEGLVAQLPPPGMAWRQWEQELSKITSGTVIRVAGHDTGRPTDLPRGRASGKTCRRSIPVVLQ